MTADKPDMWKDLENNHVTYDDRLRIAARGRALESQVAVMREALEEIEALSPLRERERRVIAREALARVGEIEA